MTDSPINKRVLFISAHFPSPKAKYAGHKTAFKILTEYYSSNYLIDMIIICNFDEIDINILKKIQHIDVIKVIPLNRTKKILNILKSHKIFPLKVMSRFSPNIIKYIRENIDKYDIFHFEFTHSAFPLFFLPQTLFKDKKIAISCHDILVQTNLRKGIKFLNVVETFKIFYYEKHIFNIASELIVHNLKDKYLLMSLYNMPENKIRLIHPPLSKFVYKVKKLKEEIPPERALIFWGAMNREENVEAVIEFVKRYKNLLRTKRYKLYVVGANPKKELLKLSSKNDNIVVTGFVEDPTEYFVKAKYGIVPLTMGGGIKIKTLEMLESGLTVISTPIGAEGIKNNSDKLIVKELKDWGKVLENIL